MAIMRPYARTVSVPGSLGALVRNRLHDRPWGMGHQGAAGNVTSELDAVVQQGTADMNDPAFSSSSIRRVSTGIRVLTDTLNEEDRDGLGEWDGVMVRSPGRSIVGMVALWWSSRRGNRWRVRASG